MLVATMTISPFQYIVVPDLAAIADYPRGFVPRSGSSYCKLGEVNLHLTSA